jgi:hypothetical protein
MANAEPGLDSLTKEKLFVHSIFKLISKYKYSLRKSTGLKQSSAGMLIQLIRELYAYGHKRQDLNSLVFGIFSS